MGYFKENILKVKSKDAKVVLVHEQDIGDQFLFS